METFKKSEPREIIEACAGSVITILFIMIFIFQSYLVKGPSMENTLHDGERLIVDKLTYRFRKPETGDIIVFKYPGDPKKKYIKRVIATEGQTIEVRDLKVKVDNMILDEPYIAEKTESGYDYSIVPDDTIFAMGDNRNRSSDSRSPDVGFIPQKSVVGRAVFIYWSPIIERTEKGFRLKWPSIRVLNRPRYRSSVDYERYIEPDLDGMGGMPSFSQEYP